MHTYMYVSDTRIRTENTPSEEMTDDLDCWPPGLQLLRTGAARLKMGLLFKNARAFPLDQILYQKMKFSIYAINIYNIKLIS